MAQVIAHIYVRYLRATLSTQPPQPPRSSTMANSGQASSLIKTQIPIYRLVTISFNPLSYADLPSGAARMGIVVFEVGPHRVKYAIHKAFLAKHSSYGGLMDLAISQQQVIDLHSVECTTCKFKNYIADSSPEGFTPVLRFCADMHV